MHPLVIISYNNHAYVESTLAQARKFGLKPIVVDNASPYEKTRVFLASIERSVEVIRLADNVGFTCWSQPEIYDRLPTRFFLTDPDLQWNNHLPPDFPSQLDDLCSTYGARKVGFALDLSDSADMFQDADYHEGRSIGSWEAQFWAHRSAHPTHEIYSAPIDTTFHLFDKTNPEGCHLRVAGDFAAKHSPWYRESSMSAHDLAHMYVPSRTSTIAKLVLREMLRKKTLGVALEACRRTCASPLAASVAEIEARVR